MRKTTVLKVVFILFFAFWVIISLLHVFQNLTKLYTEDVMWLRMSDQGKKEKLFGDKYLSLRFLVTNTPSNSIITLYSYDPDVYYFSKYVLYPRTIFFRNLNNAFSCAKEEKAQFVYIFTAHQLLPKQCNTLRLLKRFETKNTTSYLLK